MIVTKERRLMFKMGAYETYEAKAGVTVDTERDEDVADMTVDKVGEWLDERLDAMFQQDLADVKKATDNEDSFVHFYPAASN